MTHVSLLGATEHQLVFEIKKKSMMKTKLYSSISI